MCVCVRVCGYDECFVFLSVPECFIFQETSKGNITSPPLNDVLYDHTTQTEGARETDWEENVIQSYLNCGVIHSQALGALSEL